MKKGAARSCRSPMYVTTAATGQVDVSIHPTIMSNPLPNWSHFDRFKWTFNMEGNVQLFTASPHERCTAWSYWSGASTRSSPIRKNPKKARLATASSSLTVIGYAAVALSHGNWNHRFVNHAPQPHCSDASEATVYSRRDDRVGRKETPFQSSTKHCHQASSARNSTFKRIGVAPLPWTEGGDTQLGTHFQQG